MAPVVTFALYSHASRCHNTTI